MAGKLPLTQEQRRILLHKGTEPPFCGALWNNRKPGRYYCAGCRSLLFLSAAKFDSKSGWPSFFEPASKNALEFRMDRKFGMERTEVLCAKCGGHLGHVFDDGPHPGGKRFCINSGALVFTEKR